jgi:hypothetical protein
MLSDEKEIFLDNRPIVYQVRPKMNLGRALKERVAWGRVFAETRSEASTLLTNLAFAVGTAALPLLILARVAFHMVRQQNHVSIVFTTLCVATPLAVAWSIGELFGYVRTRKRERTVES